MATRSEGSPAPGALANSRSPARTEILDTLVQENFAWLRGWVRGRVVDPEIVHDICQESFLKAFRAGEKLKDTSKFSRWLFRIAQNTLRDHLRCQTRRQRWLTFSDQLDNREAPERIEGSEDAEKLLEAIRGLPSIYREPLLLKHSEDLSYARIAEILGIRENAVQVRVFRARKLLQKRLKKFVEP